MVEPLADLARRKGHYIGKSVLFQHQGSENSDCIQCRRSLHMCPVLSTDRSLIFGYLGRNLSSIPLSV